jgi:Tfp pilus assembly protein PilX
VKIDAGRDTSRFRASNNASKAVAVQKAESKLNSGEKQFRKERRAQLNRWEKEHPHARKSAAQHLGKPAAKRKGTKKAA